MEPEVKLTNNNLVSTRSALVVFVAALGYFVDVFDLVLFSIVRTESLRELGVEGADLLSIGVRLLNWQMFGLCLGGLLWGVLGDRIGRVQALFGSILLYSLANIANGLVTSVEQYEVLRFLSGFGLAGEVGGAVTLVGEVLSKERRGWGTTLVAAAGAAGAVVASFSAGILSWRMMYFVGGGLGLLLLVLRVVVAESEVFEAVKRTSTVSRGSLRLLLSNRERATRLFALLFIGGPFIFAAYTLATFSPEVAQDVLGASGVTSAGAVGYFAVGVTIGDLVCGILSQYLRSRKKPMMLFVSAGSAATLALLAIPFASPEQFSAWFFVIGFFGGTWAVLVTTATEQYGTNIRATVTTAIPNFVRALSIPIGYVFLLTKGAYGIQAAVSGLSVGLLVLALWGVWRIRETFGIPLTFVEVAGGQKQLGDAPQMKKAV
jgi:putative MFS transporter